MDLSQLDMFFLPEDYFLWRKWAGRRVPWRHWMGDWGNLGVVYAPLAEVVIDGESFALSLRWTARGRREQALAVARLGDDAMGE